MSDISIQTPARPGRFALCALIVALLQSAALGWMIYDRISLIEHGREMVLDTIPVDPRSLFRGDYVILNYPISSLEPATLDGDDEFARGDMAFVTLRKSDAGTWEAVSLSRSYPPEASTSGGMVLRGKARYDGGKTLLMDYGIESYFVPEGEGKALEGLVRERKLQVLLAVASDGEAAIKGLLVDGELRYEEPLF